MSTYQCKQEVDSLQLQKREQTRKSLFSWGETVTDRKCSGRSVLFHPWQKCVHILGSCSHQHTNIMSSSLCRFMERIKSVVYFHDAQSFCLCRVLWLKRLWSRSTWWNHAQAEVTCRSHLPRHERQTRATSTGGFRATSRGTCGTSDLRRRTCGSLFPDASHSSHVFKPSAVNVQITRA